MIPEVIKHALGLCGEPHPNIFHGLLIGLSTGLLWLRYAKNQAALYLKTLFIRLCTIAY